MFSSESRRREVTEQMWYAAEDCSRSVQRRLEKLSRRRLRVVYGEQTVHDKKRNADAFETPTLLNGEAHQRGMTMPGHEDIDQGGQLSVRDGTFIQCSHNSLDFPYKTLWHYFDENPLTGYSNARAMKNIAISTNISLYLENETR